MANVFKAMIVREMNDQTFVREIGERSIDELPAGDILIKVHYSSLNYKDALSATGNKGVTRNYPHTPGIDAAGFVAESNTADFQEGDAVLVTGYDLGMNTDGGFGQYIRVPADWVVKLPQNLSLKESMMYGTAGLTAGMAITKLIENGVIPGQGDILVTGATGGVGSLAVALLAKIGFSVTAATGKMDQKQYLLDLGATNVVNREDVTDTSKRPLLKGKWAGVIDTVGGEILSTAIRSTQHNGAVTCCGNVASPFFNISVFPFILRNVDLLGVESAECPMDFRLNVWDHLASDWKLDCLERVITERSLDELNAEIDRILKGKQLGRVLVNLTM